MFEGTLKILGLFRCMPATPSHRRRPVSSVFKTLDGRTSKLATSGSFSGFRRNDKAKGFTLVETLVALVIAATAAAVILSHVRTLMLRAEKEQSHQLAVLQLLNDSLRVSYGNPATSLPPRIEQDALVLDAGRTSDGTIPPIRVRNFSVQGEQLPPISFAYTPLQLFITERDRYAIHAVSAALASPVAADAVTASSVAP